MADEIKNIPPGADSSAEQLIRRFRPPEQAIVREKRRRLSTIIFLVNIVILTALFVFHARRSSINEYQSHAFTYRDVIFRFSQMKDRDSGDYLFTLTLKPMPGKSVGIPFHDGVAELAFYHGDDLLFKKSLGAGVRLLSLAQGETKAFRETIPREEFDRIAVERPEWIAPAQRLLFEFERSYIPIRMDLVICDDRKMSILMQFRHEVNR